MQRLLVTAPLARRGILWCALAINGGSDASKVDTLGAAWGRDALTAAAAALDDGTLTADTLASWSAHR